MSDKKQYIFNKSEEGKKANILIDGEISSWWGVGLQDLAKDIANSGADEIMMQINSGGGSVFEGMAISAFIKSNPVQISTSILGLCASIATPIALSGRTTSIAKGSLFMIHNASAVTGGEASDLRSTADLLETMDDQLVKIYADTIEANSKLINNSREETEAQIREWQNEETWFTAEEAVHHGFIQTLTDGAEFLNKAQAVDIVNTCSKYKNVPATFLNKVKTIANMAEPKENNTEKTGIIETVKAWFKSNPKEAQDAIKGLQEDQDAKAQAKKEEAIALAKQYGFYKEPEAVAVVEEVEEVEVEANDANAEKIAELTAKLEASELKAQKLEEEKTSAPATGPKVDNSNLTAKEKTFNQIIASQKEAADAMAKAIFS